MRSLLIYLFAGFQTLAFAAPVPAPLRNLTLEEAVRVALQNSTAVLLAKNDLTYSGVALMQSYAQFLPNLQFTAGDQYSSGSALVTTATPVIVQSKSTALSYQLASDLNLFNGFGDLANFNTSLAKKSAAEWTLVRAQQQIAIDVTQSYLQVILDQQIEEIAEANLKTSNDRLGLFKAQKALGTIAVVDLYRQQAQASLDHLFLIQSHAKTKDDLLNLIRKLRMETKDNYHLTVPNLKPKNSLQDVGAEADLIEVALKKRPDLASSEKILDAYEWDIKKEDSGYLPKLDLVGTYGGNGRYLYQQNVAGADVLPPVQDDLLHQINHQTEYTLGLTLTWSIFDRLVTTMQRAKAVQLEKSAKIDFQDLRNQVISEVRQALTDLRSAEDQVETSAVGVESAQKAMEALQGRFKVGMSNFIDLETSQAALVQARSSEAQAVVNRYLQSKILELVTGNTPAVYEP